MRPRPAQWISAAFLLFSSVALAEPLGYAAGFRDLYRVDLASGQSTLLGPIGFNDVEGLAMSPSGVLYGAADATMIVGGLNSSTTDFLLRMDPATGKGTLVGQLPGLQLQGVGTSGALDYGLSFTCDGRLWMASATTGSLWEVDPGTAQVRLVGNTGTSISGLAAAGNQLFGVSISPDPTLFRISTETGAATPVGALGIGSVVASVGLDFDASGVLWAVVTPEPIQVGPSRTVRIDTTTGAGTVTGSVNASFPGFEGLAIAPPGACGVSGTPAAPVMVPGPGAPLLWLLAGVAGLFGGRRLRVSR